MTVPSTGGLSDGLQSYRARWIVPVGNEPIEQGTVEIEAGQIVAVHNRVDNQSVDLGNVAILPGLVNAHTHLEFSMLREPITPTMPFTDWIRAVRTERISRTANVSTADVSTADVSTADVSTADVSTADAVAAGLAESAAGGTTTLGEIATAGWSPAPFTSTTPRAVLFRELIGLRADQTDAQLAIARDHLAAGDGAKVSEDVRYGLSPHAPYSVHPDLFFRLTALANEHRAPLAIHLAETRAELELLAHGRGEFVRMLKEFGVWDQESIPQGSRPLDYLEPLADLDAALIIHGNYLSDDEIDFLGQHPNLTVVYCPRTHAGFGHSPHPWRRLMEQGGSVAIGTDSRASNPDLSLWWELCFLRERFPDVSPQKLLELGTIHGARALGMGETTGMLAVGRSADLIVVSLEASGVGDIVSTLLHRRNRITATMRSGRWITPAGI